ncbi:MmcQ/YjbR family DNA-binding protein [Nostoc sp. NIES-2111]
MTWDDVVAFAAQFPGVEEATSYGTPALKVRGKLLTRLRPEDSSLTLHDVPPEERELLVEAEPGRFHTTPHYAGYPIVLACLSELNPDRLWPFIDRRWRSIAGRRLIAEYDMSRDRHGEGS